MKNNKQDKAFITLIEKGILIKKVFPQNKLFKFANPFYYSLTDEFKEEFLNHVYDIIKRNIRILKEHHFQMMINQLNSFPDKIRDEKIILKIEKIQKEISPYVLDTESENLMVLDFFNYDDYLKFHEGKLKVLLNESLKDFIRDKALKEVIFLLKNEYNKKKNNKETVSKTTYQWQNNPDKELPELYKLMIEKYKLIASDTTLEQFIAIFTGQPINDIEPIKWHQDNASELLYFINRLGQSNNIEYNPNKADYQKMTACFVKPDGKPFKAVWKSLKTNLETNLSPNKQRAIDELVSNF